MEKQLPTKSELLLAIQWASVFISDCHLGVYNLVCLNRLYDFLDRIAEPSFGYKQLIKDNNISVLISKFSHHWPLKSISLSHRSSKKEKSSVFFDRC